MNNLAGFRAADLEAVQMRSGRWIVRPRGAVGTCGFYPRAWAAVSVSARNAAAAIKKAIA